jgi:putative transcriptional regulator
MNSYHPTPELLAAYSAGTLALSHALCIATHLETCQQCLANVKRLNSIGAQLLEQLEPVVASASLKDSVFAKLDDTPVKEQADTVNYQTQIPRALRQFISDDYASLPWQTVSPGIQAAKLCIDTNGAKVEMLRIKPGGKVPTHTHTGDEYTIILEGSFSDDNGIYKAGDFLVRDGRHKHKPIVTNDRECICLTVTDAPIEFTGFFTRWLNPFLRKSHLAH